MVFAKKKGYRTERKIREIFEKYGWKVVRAGGSLGEADLICIKNKKCILLQVKSTRKEPFYYYGYCSKEFEGFPFYLVVDFGYGKIRITKPKQKITLKEGEDLEIFLAKN